MSQTTAKGNFYDLGRLKQIPIIEVCNKFGIDLERKGGQIWCKLRSERTASVILHPDRNTFHDFGTNETSDNIGLVSIVCNVERKDAIKKLADAFYISPDNPRAGLQANDLTSWEYKMIGLDGQMATRNFNFDLSRQSVERVSEISLRYAMPMNVLKKENPRIFEKLIKQRAIPHVRDLREEYYKNVFSRYNLAKAIGSEQTFHNAVNNGEFESQIEELQNAEAILERACRGTQITALPVGTYHPAEDIKKILAGEIWMSLGNQDFQKMKKISETESSALKYRTVEFNGFRDSYTALSVFPHSAFLKNGNVVVAYLEKDHTKIKPILDKIKIPTKSNLNQKIENARQRQGRQSSSESTQKSKPPEKHSIGEER